MAERPQPAPVSRMPARVFRTQPRPRPPVGALPLPAQVSRIRARVFRMQVRPAPSPPLRAVLRRQQAVLMSRTPVVRWRAALPPQHAVVPLRRMLVEVWAVARILIRLAAQRAPQVAEFRRRAMPLAAQQ